MALLLLVFLLLHIILQLSSFSQGTARKKGSQLITGSPTRGWVGKSVGILLLRRVAVKSDSQILLAIATPVRASPNVAIASIGLARLCLYCASLRESLPCLRCAVPALTVPLLCFARRMRCLAIAGHFAASPSLCHSCLCVAFAVQDGSHLGLRQSFRSFAFAVQAWAVLSSALAELLIAGPSLSSSAQNTAIAVHSSALHGLCFALLHVAAPLQSRPLRSGAFAKPRPASLCLCNAGQGCATPWQCLSPRCFALPSLLRAALDRAHAVRVRAIPCLCHVWPLYAVQCRRFATLLGTTPHLRHAAHQRAMPLLC